MATERLFGLNSLASFAPPNRFENLAVKDYSWVFDATDVV